METVQSSNNKRRVIRPSHEFPQALLLDFRLRQRQKTKFQRIWELPEFFVLQIPLYRKRDFPFCFFFFISIEEGILFWEWALAFGFQAKPRI